MYRLDIILTFLRKLFFILEWPPSFRNIFLWYVVYHLHIIKLSSFLFQVNNNSDSSFFPVFSCELRSKGSDVLVQITQ